MLLYPIAPTPDSSARKNQGLGVEKVGKTKKFSEWTFPGVENVPTPLETIFNVSRGPQRPYTGKSRFSKLN